MEKIKRGGVTMYKRRYKFNGKRCAYNLTLIAIMAVVAVFGYIQVVEWNDMDLSSKIFFGRSIPFVLIIGVLVSMLFNRIEVK